jgi:regulator of replication initiation timing
MTGKTALRMTCPHYRVIGEHPVEMTDPSAYRWNDETGPMFKRLVGRDLSYRMRYKRCIGCRQQFSTVEMCDDYLRALMKEIARLERAVTHLQQDNIILTSEFAALKERRQAELTRNQQLEEKLSHAQAEVDRLKDGLTQLADTATELGCRKQTPLPEAIKTVQKSLIIQELASTP